MATTKKTAAKVESKSTESEATEPRRLRTFEERIAELEELKAARDAKRKEKAIKDLPTLVARRDRLASQLAKVQAELGALNAEFGLSVPGIAEVEDTDEVEDTENA